MNMELNAEYEVSQEQLDEYSTQTIDRLLSSVASLECLELEIETISNPTDVIASVESIMSVVSDIRKSGGVCRNDALLLRSISTSMEGIGDEFRKIPVNSFTEMPSLVNYGVSTEGFVSDAIESIRRVIRNIIEWIKKQFAKAKAFFTGSQTNVAKVDIATKKVVEETKHKKPLTDDQQLKELVKVAEKLDTSKLFVPENTVSRSLKRDMEELKKKVDDIDVGKAFSPANTAKSIHEKTKDDLRTLITDAMVEAVDNGYFKRMYDGMSAIIRDLDGFFMTGDFVRFVNNMNKHFYDLTDNGVTTHYANLKPVGEYQTIEELDKLLHELNRQYSKWTKDLSTKSRSKDKAANIKDPIAFVNKMAGQLDSLRKYSSGSDLSTRVASMYKHYDRILEDCRKKAATETDMVKLKMLNQMVHIFQSTIQTVTRAPQHYVTGSSYVTGKMASIVAVYV